jgi:hypothetical protein
MCRQNKSDKVHRPALASTRLLDQVRERIRYLHYSLQTEKGHLYWARFFVLWSAKAGGMRHPRDRNGVDFDHHMLIVRSGQGVVGQCRW